MQFRQAWTKRHQGRGSSPSPLLFPLFATPTCDVLRFRDSASLGAIATERQIELGSRKPERWPAARSDRLREEVVPNPRRKDSPYFSRDLIRSNAVHALT